MTVTSYTWAAVVYFREMRQVWIKPLMSPPGAAARTMGNYYQQGRCRNRSLTRHSHMERVQLCWFKQLSLYLHAERGQNLTIQSCSLNSRHGSRQGRKKNPNNCQRAKEGPTAPGRSCQSPTLGRLQQKSPRVNFGFLFLQHTGMCEAGAWALY